jgi:peptidylamidoglycolate lyase
MFIMPHGLTVDRNDNVWLTDVGRHQVFKFAADGRLLLTLGERGVAGADSAHFNLPTDVAVRPDGEFYVSDGYQNTRVLRFDAQGRFLSQWGKPGKGAGEFDLPHGLALDKAGRVYVADRSNARVQVFDSTGHFIADWHGPLLGRPYGVAVSPDGTIFSVDGGDQPRTPPDRGGATHLRADGTVLERFAGFGNYDGQFRLAHDVAVGADGAVYVVDAWGQRVQKFTCRR